MALTRIERRRRIHYRIRKHVLHAHGLKDGTHSTTGLDTGTGRCGLHKHAGTAELRLLLVRDGGVDDRNLHEILLRILHTLRNRGGDFVRLAKTIAYDTVLVTDDDDGSETEVTAALGHLGDALDRDQSVLELKVRRLYSLNISICHSLNS